MEAARQALEAANKARQAAQAAQAASGAGAGVETGAGTGVGVSGGTGAGGTTFAGAATAGAAAAIVGVEFFWMLHEVQQNNIQYENLKAAEVDAQVSNQLAVLRDAQLNAYFSQFNDAQKQAYLQLYNAGVPALLAAQAAIKNSGCSGQGHLIDPRTLPKPDGMSNSQFGDLIGWTKNEGDVLGKMSETGQAILNLPGNLDNLRAAGVTADMAQLWADYYFQEALRNPQNPNAAPRAVLMTAIARGLSR